ncbi:polyprenol monophosphomannose synthase [Botrimarina hoheduenensis]|uniref:Undecaprenyl-phosphate mannosyltransferase n=1 Tax=Botrimarina hoheduenensis TaxID=2528000 RepID=A0A5C5WCB9_9BACT|nr:polyprenol monophosphomannose synthase [Botrimarina hoheduenensis]TWT47739.1 Undecaprenyl-phosphate mannosyltransferase [Botrimarina hoheduenensis]
MAQTLVAIATYNEIENLPTLVEAVLARVPQAEVLIVDDNSPDGTGAWAAQRAKADPRVRLLSRQGKLGLGSATLAAMRVAIDEGYDVVATLDADWSHPPDRLPKLLELIDAGADVAIGSRYVAGGAIVDWPLQRRLASRFVNTAARWLLWLPTQDCSGAFRAYRVDALRRLDFTQLRCTGYAYLEEILWRLKQSGARFAEAPITFTERRAGASKINRSEVYAAARLLVRLGAIEWFGSRRS